MILIPPTIKAKPEFCDMIIDIICSHHGVKFETVIQDRSKGKYAHVRNFCIHFCRLYTDASWKGLTRRFDRTRQTLYLDDNHLSYRIRHKDRKVYSMYVTHLECINDIIKSLYPVTWDERTATLFTPFQNPEKTWIHEKNL